MNASTKSYVVKLNSNEIEFKLKFMVKLNVKSNVKLKEKGECQYEDNLLLYRKSDFVS